MLRVAATIRHGHVPGSLLVARLQASARQNRLTQAIQEYGRIIKTISILRYLHNEQHRRRVHTQLNKGESIHALRGEIQCANRGEIRRRDNEDQSRRLETWTDAVHLVDGLILAVSAGAFLALPVLFLGTG